MTDDFLKDLRDLAVLYSKTKGYVLTAEQIDPESRSNIAIFKEQRDALDHIMRALTEAFGGKEQPDFDYLKAQVDKARGHLFRAAYDALDGVGVSCKIRIQAAVRGVSNDAIVAVYKEYYNLVSEVDAIDAKIAEHRKTKDVQRSTMDDLDAYCNDVDRLAHLSREVTQRIPGFAEWKRRNRRKTWLYVIAFPLGIALAGAIFKLGGDYYLNKAKAQPQAAAQAAPATINPTSGKPTPQKKP